MSQADYHDLDREWMQKMADKGRAFSVTQPVVKPPAIDDRDLAQEGFVCSSCAEPFSDGGYGPRECRACGGQDDSRHDELAR